MKNLISIITLIVVIAGFTFKTQAQSNCGVYNIPFHMPLSNCTENSSPTNITYTSNNGGSSEVEFGFYNNNTGLISLGVDSIYISQDAILKFEWSHGLDNNFNIYEDSLALRVRKIGSNSWTTIWNKYDEYFNSRDGSDNNTSGYFIKEELFLGFEFTGDTVEFEFIGKGDINPSASANAFISNFIIEPHLCLTVLQTPFMENFDGSSWVLLNQSSLSQSKIDPCWINTPEIMDSLVFTSPTSALHYIFNYSWLVNSTFNQSNNTGPSADHTGGGKYLYTEGSIVHSISIANLITPAIDISNLNQPELSFWYHMYGDSIRTLYVDLYDRTSWSTIDSIVGEQQMASTDPWLQRKILLSPISDTIRVRFRANWGNHSTTDIAIDDFRIQCAQQVVPSISYTATQTTTTSTSATFDFDASTTANGVNYTWDFGGGVIKNGQQVSHTYTNFGSSEMVKLSVDGGCGLIKDSTFTVSPSAIGIEENDALASVKIFPNPTTGNITIQLGEVQEKITVSLTSIYGQKIAEKEFANTDELKMNFEASKGLYILQLETSTGLVSTYKILKE